MNEIKWPEDPFERLEAKIDNLRDNHLQHVQAGLDMMEQRTSSLESGFAKLGEAVQELKNAMSRRQTAGVLTGVATLILVIILVL